MLKFQLQRSQDLIRIDDNVISADTTIVRASFNHRNKLFGKITSYWRRDDTNETFKAELSSAGECDVPWEVLVHRETNRDYGGLDHIIYVSLADEQIITTSECIVKVHRSVYSTSAADSGDIPVGPSGGGAVNSVNGQIGDVVLSADDVGIYVSDAEPTNAADGDVWFDINDDEDIIKVVGVDFSLWEDGLLSLSLSDGTVSNYSISFDDSGNPISITDPDGIPTIIHW